MKIPKNVKLVDSWTFLGCPELTELIIFGSKTKLGKEIYDMSTELTIHAPAGSYAETYAKENNIPFVAE